MGCVRTAINYDASVAVVCEKLPVTETSSAAFDRLFAECRGRFGNVARISYNELECVGSFHKSILTLGEIIKTYALDAIVFDITSFSRRYILMLLSWVDCKGLWGRLMICYCEPSIYNVSRLVPLSYGLEAFHQVPGFPAAGDMSRPVHFVIFLGYDGGRAMSAYEDVQPVKTTLLISTPVSNEVWPGRTGECNSALIAIVGNSDKTCVEVEPINPYMTFLRLEEVIGRCDRRGEFVGVVCPLGPKPQVVGLYYYIRECIDPPAVLYSNPIHESSSLPTNGIGAAWVLKRHGNN